MPGHGTFRYCRELHLDAPSLRIETSVNFESKVKCLNDLFRTLALASGANCWYDGERMAYQNS